MSLLGWYLLISMMFVFAAMVEFAFVVLIKQRQELRNTGDNIGNCGSKSDERPKHIPSEASNVWINVMQARSNVVNVEETDELERKESSFWNRRYVSFIGLPLTTKIDMAGIVLFHFSYMIFKIIYWVPMRNLLYEKI